MFSATLEIIGSMLMGRKLLTSRVTNFTPIEAPTSIGVQIDVFHALGNVPCCIG